jgi:dihydrofolate reductase
MGRLIYAMNVSLDGFVDTPDHSLDWTLVDEDLHRWWNDQERATSVALYGRRIYEVMSAYWPTAATDPNATPVMLEFAGIWNPMPKVVFSRTLDSVAGNSRLAKGDVEDELRRVRSEFPGDIQVSGPTLAASFIERGLVDEYRLVVHPVILGAGTPFFPGIERPIGLRPTDTHTFPSGVIYLGYAAT